MIYYKLNNMYKNIINYIILKYIENNKITKDNIIIYPNIDNEINEVDDTLNELGFRYIIISNNNIDKDLINKIKTKDLILIPSFGIDNLFEMANDMKLEINNSIIINLFEEKLGITYFYKEYAKTLYDNYKNINELIIPLKYPYLSGVAKYFKMKNEDIKIIGIKYEYESKIIDYDLFDEIIDNLDTCKSDNNILFLEY